MWYVLRLVITLYLTVVNTHDSLDLKYFSHNTNIAMHFGQFSFRLGKKAVDENWHVIFFLILHSNTYTIESWKYWKIKCFLFVVYFE